MNRKGSAHLVVGFATIALFVVIAFVVINAISPEAGARILQSITALAHAIRG